jgi:hypothetical protein
MLKEEDIVKSQLQEQFNMAMFDVYRRAEEQANAPPILLAAANDARWL